MGTKCYTSASFIKLVIFFACKIENADCQNLSRGPNFTPNLTVRYDRPPSFVLESKTFVATCSGFSDMEQTIFWVLKRTGSTVSWTTLIARGNKTLLYVPDFDIKVTQRREGGNITSTLAIDLINPEKFDGAKLICITTAVSNNIDLECPGLDLNRLCMESKTIRVMVDARRPDLVVKYTTPLPIVYVGQTLVATCSAFVGENGHMTWALHINKTVILGDDKKYFISFVTDDIYSYGVIKSSVLRIDHFSIDLNGMQIACFSYDIGKFPRRAFTCFDYDELCELSPPLRVYYPSEWEIEFGRDRIHRYIWAAVVWTALVLIIHIYIWMRDRNLGPRSAVGEEAGFYKYSEHTFDDYTPNGSTDAARRKSQRRSKVESEGKES